MELNSARSYLIDILKLSDDVIDAIEKAENLSDEQLMNQAIATTTTFGYTPEQYAENLKDIYADAFSILKPRDFSEAAAAEVFARRCKGELWYTDLLGWLIYNPAVGVWETDSHAAMLKVIAFADAMLFDAAEEYKQAIDSATEKLTVNNATEKKSIPKEVKDYFQFAKHMKSKNCLENVLSLAEHYLHIDVKVFDAEPAFLNTAGGIVDLKTGMIKPHDSKDLCTKIAPYTPNHDGETLWNDFVDLVTCHDADIKKYLQLKLGMACIGEVSIEQIDFAIGGGRNGKSTLFNAVQTVLGDYAGSVDPDILTTSKESISVYKATLRGKRFITCGELEEGQRLSAKALKQIASTDPMTIKQLYHDPETITPTHHIFLFTNFLPKVGSAENGTWRRIAVIPFNAVMPTGDAEILNYADYLAKNAGGAILTWLIEGAKQFYANNCKVKAPKAIKEATEKYRSEQDWLSVFVSEVCTTGKNLEVKAGMLYDQYKIFASESRDFVRSKTQFCQAMELAGYKKVSKGGNKKFWHGLDISEEYTASSAERTYNNGGLVIINQAGQDTN